MPRSHPIERRPSLRMTWRNLRTYVRSREHTGVWFFSLDAASWLAVRGARATFALPYFDARMSIEQADDGGWLCYRSVRRSGFGAPPAQFAARYRPTGDPQPASPGSLEHIVRELDVQAHTPVHVLP